MRWHYFAIVPVVAFSLFQVLLFIFLRYLPNHYIFSPARLHEIVNESLISLDIDASPSAVMDSVHKALKEEYPGYISEIPSENWLFNNAGNAMGQMVVLHASVTEYLIFFGTVIGTSGHTGTHFADDYFTILTGTQYAALPNATSPERYLPGDQHHLPYGLNKHYSMPGGSFALELAQGYIPFMLPFGMIEVLTSTFDFATFLKTCKISSMHMGQNLLKGKL